jgi:hypothetical protein
MIGINPSRPGKLNNSHRRHLKSARPNHGTARIEIPAATMTQAHVYI